MFRRSQPGFLLGLNSFGEVRTLQKRPSSASLTTSQTPSIIINNHTKRNSSPSSLFEQNLERSYTRPGSAMITISESIERRRMEEQQKARQDIWNTSKTAKSLPDSGISAPSGNPELSALLSVTGCTASRMGTAGHVLGFDFFKSNILLNPHAMERSSSSTLGIPQSSTDQERRGSSPSSSNNCVGAISFNEAVMNCPSALQCCTACNRTDFYDKASNMGLCTSWEMPYHAFEETDNRRRMGKSSSRPMVCRAYVSKTRVRPTKELDTMEIGHAMCTNGCSFGLTYMGAAKVDPLTTIVNDSTRPFKKKMVRYSIAKLLRQKLPALLEERLKTEKTKTKKTQESTELDIEEEEEEEEEDEEFPWKPTFHRYVFCSFEHTRLFLSGIVPERSSKARCGGSTLRDSMGSALLYLKKKLVRQFAWLVRTKKISAKDFYTLDHFVGTATTTKEALRGDNITCPLSVKVAYARMRKINVYERDATDSHEANHYDDSLPTDDRRDQGGYRYGVEEQSKWFHSFLHTLSHTTWNQSWYESADVFSAERIFKDTKNKSSSGQDYDRMTDPPEWRGPWYKSTQCFDEDEMVFYNLDYGYLVHAYQWVCGQLHRLSALEEEEDFGDEDEVFSEFSVLCTMLLKLYCVNDLMHALCPTRDRMMRLMLQLFADQMLDLYSHFLFDSGGSILDDADLLFSALEREEFLEFKAGKTTRLFGEEWNKRCKTRDAGKSLQRLYDQLYPHGRRFVWSGELPELSHLLVFTELWNKVRPCGDSIACFIIHIMLGKAQPHRCQIRSLATVLKQCATKEPSIIILLIDMLMIHVLGNYPGAAHRPCYRSRAILRQQFFEFSVRDVKEIANWVDVHQHFVYICLREHLYLQMEKVFALRGMMADLSWQLENEVHTRYVSEMCRVILSDRLRKTEPRYFDRFIATDSDFKNMQDISADPTHVYGIREDMQYYVEEMDGKMREWENKHAHCPSAECASLPRFMFSREYSPHSPATRDIIYTHMLIGYRERLHMKKMADEDADKIIYTMKQKDIFELLEVVSDEAGIKSREYQTKSRKGNFTERLLQDMHKLIVTYCPHVFELEMKEKLDNARLLEGIALGKKRALEKKLEEWENRIQSAEGKRDIPKKVADLKTMRLVNKVGRANKTYRVFKSHRERVEQNMLSDISSYTSNVYSVMECDGILSGNHIKAIKLMAKLMAESTEDAERLDLTFLLLLGVSMSSISYLYFLLYTYNYHDLPDNRLKTDVVYLLNKRYQKPKKKKKAKRPPKGKKKQVRKCTRRPKKRAKRKDTPSEASTSNEPTESSGSIVEEDKGEEREQQKPIMCYGTLAVPWEDWFDINLVDFSDDVEERGGPLSKERSLDEEDTSTPPFFSVTPHRTMDIMKISRKEIDERLKTLLMGPLGKDVTQTPQTSCDPYLCYDPTRCDTVYRDDDDDLCSDENGEVQWRRKRVFSVLGRGATVGEMDVAVITMFFHFYLHAKFLKVIPLTSDIAELQTRALVRRANLVYSNQPIPKDIGITRFCGCGKWVDPIVTGPNDISMIYANGEDLAAYDLLRKCKRCHKGETRFCETLNEIDMIGKVVCFGRFAFVICVICGSRTIWRRESYCDLGPTCGCHAAPIRPPSKYPISVVALKSKRNMELRRAMLNNGMLLNGWVECCYCKEYIIPGKVHSFVVWDDISYYERMPTALEELDDDEEEGIMEEDLERHSKSGHVRKTIVHMCEDHVKYIRWNIKNVNGVYTKRRMFQDIRDKTQRGMERRMSTRYARAT